MGEVSSNFNIGGACPKRLALNHTSRTDSLPGLIRFLCCYVTHRYYCSHAYLGAITTGCMRPFVPRTNKNELTTTALTHTMPAPQKKRKTPTAGSEGDDLQASGSCRIAIPTTPTPSLPLAKRAKKGQKLSGRAASQVPKATESKTAAAMPMPHKTPRKGRENKDFADIVFPERPPLERGSSFHNAHHDKSGGRHNYWLHAPVCT